MLAFGYILIAFLAILIGHTSHHCLAPHLFSDPIKLKHVSLRGRYP
jgi:hypothetical protein